MLAPMNPAEREVLRELAPGERLLWSGRPPQGFRLTRADIFLVPFSLAWCGFAVFWEAMVLTSGAPVLMAAWGVPFVLAGLYIVAGRFVVDARGRARTFYGLTDQRVVFVTGAFSRTVTSIGLRDLNGIELTETSGGSGSIAFGASMQFPFPFAMQGAAWPGTQSLRRRAFELAEGAREVHSLVMRARDQMAQPPASSPRA